MNRFSSLAQPRREPQSAGGLTAILWSALAGLLVPVLVILFGVISVLLNEGGLTDPDAALGTHLVIPLPLEFTRQTPLVQLTELVGVSFLVAALFSLAVWRHRRSADRRAREVVKGLHTRVLHQSLRRAEVEGAAAQHVRAKQLIGHHLPHIQKGLSLWFRTIPRSLFTLLGCVILALLVNVWLALLAFVSGVLLWQLFRRMRHDGEPSLAEWEVPRTRGRMAELVGQAPLLARLQSQGLADRAFAVELESLYKRLTQRDAEASRVWPLLFLATAAAIAVLLLGLGVNLFGADNGLSLPSVLVLGLALGGAAAAAGRLMRLVKQLRVVGEASDSVYHYLRRNSEIAPSEQRVGLAGLRDSVEIQDVTLVQSTGQPILSNLSLKFAPRSLVALLGTDPVSTKALAELLMGFGMPTEGRVSIDGIPLRDVHPQALARNVMWIEPDGPLWDGTIYENLRGSDDAITNSEIVDALTEVDVYERLQRLPEGCNTIIAPHDTTIGTDVSYGIAVARALLHKPAVLLALEPPPPTEHLSEDPCLKALKKLVERGTLVIILPRRLQTLRQADRVVLLNGARFAGEGKHSDLLTNSDLYRHINYLLFNPYHQVAQNR